MRRLGDIALQTDVKTGDVIHAPNNRIYYVLETIELRDSQLSDIARTLSVLVISSNNEPKLFEYYIPKYANENYPFAWKGVYMALGK